MHRDLESKLEAILRNTTSDIAELRKRVELGPPESWDLGKLVARITEADLLAQAITDTEGAAEEAIRHLQEAVAAEDSADPFWSAIVSYRAVGATRVLGLLSDGGVTDFKMHERLNAPRVQES